MAEFVVKIADERGHLLEQIENGYSEAEVRDRFVQQGFLVYWVKPRGVLSGGLRRRGKVKQGQFLIFNSQFLTLIKAGLPILSSLDLLIKRQRDPYLQSLLQNVRDRVKAGELLSDAFSGAGGFSKNLYQHADGGREERQHGRSALALHRVSEDGADFQEKAGGFAGVSDSAGDGRVVDAGFPGHLRGAAVCQALSGYGRATAGDHADHAEYRKQRAKILSDFRDWGGGCAAGLLAVEEDRSRGGTRRPRHSRASSARAKSG